METKPKRKSNRGVGCVVVILLVLVAYGYAQRQNSPSGRATQTAQAIARESQPAMVYSASAYAQAMSSGLGIVAGGRTILDVRIADGRENGGDRAFFISYVSTETSDGAKVEEYLDLFDGAAATIAARNLDVDSVALIEANSRGDALQTIVAQADDLADWHNVRITRSQMLNRLEFTDF